MPFKFGIGLVLRIVVRALLTNRIRRVADDNPNGRLLLPDHALGIGVEHFRKKLVGIVRLGKLERVCQTDAIERAVVLLLADQIVIDVLDVD